MIQILKRLKSKVLTRGIVLVGIMCAGIFMQSCSQDNDFSEITINEDEKSLNLTAPNGEKIADNISGLKEIVAVSVAEKFGTDREFSVTSLEYIPVREGYSVLIKYKTSDNITGGLIRTNSKSLLFSPCTTITMPVESRNADKGNSAKRNGITIIPVSIGENEAYMPTFTMNSDGSVSYGCGSSSSSCECILAISFGD
jgi:hypothetical protein